jgi:hypothetical protein
MYAVYVFESVGDNTSSWGLGIKHIDEDVLRRRYSSKNKEQEPKKLGILFYLFDHAENATRRVRNLLETYPENTPNLVDKVRSLGEEIGIPFVHMH